MEFNIFYKKKSGWYIGHIQEYPDYESQGRTWQDFGRIEKKPDRDIL